MNLESIIVAAIFTFLAGIAVGIKGTFKFGCYWLHSEHGRKFFLDYMETHKDCPLYEGHGLTHRVNNSVGKDVNASGN